MATKAKIVPAKKAFKTPVEDVTDRLPSLPPKGTPTVNVHIVSTVEWFDGWRLHKEGEEAMMTFPVDEDGEPVLNPHVVRAEDYEAPEIDLPGTSLAKGARQAVRGGATGMPSL